MESIVDIEEARFESLTNQRDTGLRQLRISTRIRL